MTIADLNGKSVCILGFGQEGQATLRAIEAHAPDAKVTIADQNSKLQVPNSKHNIQAGSDYLNNLDQFDVVIKSPGIPPCKELEAVKDKLTNSTQIFLDTVKETGSLVIGVTGSKGKSTTASLIYEVLKAGGNDVHLVGNIGIPTLDFVEKAKLNTIFVQEMSSYQLMDLTISPHIAVVTAFFPDHLDYHGSLDAYKEAKMHITKFQTEKDYVFFDTTSEGAREIAEQSSGIHVGCSSEDALVRMDEVQLIGEHNHRDIGIACEAGEHFHVDKEAIRSAIKNFAGLPHRLQSLGVHHDIEWIDDAISTTPESTIAGIQALGDRVHTIILGGQDRGYDFTELGTAVANSGIKHVILFPDSGDKIKEAIEAADSDIEFHNVETMEQAIKKAKACHAEPSRSVTRLDTVPSFDRAQDDTVVPICLLSTASPSYNMFKNFEEKGDEFKKSILETETN